MSKDIAINVSALHKSFKVPHDKNNSLKSAALNIFKKKRYTEMLAADGIDFSVNRGEFLGIIGRNGSGKSTMLKMLAGIYLPDKGKIEINGKLSPFLEVGVGFNPELSGRDNIYLSGTILGLTKKEIDAKFEEIVEFAEMAEFIDQKVKNYSSGMQVRLAFSVAIQAHSDILLIDEVLAVGDTNFQAKCNRVFHRLKKEGRTIVFVTHSMQAVSEFCDRVILLKDGKIFKEGFPKDVISEYDRLNFENGGDSSVDSASWGDLKAEVKTIKYLSGQKDLLGKVAYNKSFSICVGMVNNSTNVLSANLSIEIFKMDGTKCFGVTTNGKKSDYFAIHPGSDITKQLNINGNSLIPGQYYIDFRLFEKTDLESIFHASSYASQFTVSGESAASGVTDLGYSWEESGARV